MKYTSQNADNLARFVPNGDYLVTVVEASETFSKAGDEMIKLKLAQSGRTSENSLFFETEKNRLKAVNQEFSRQL